MSNNKSIIRAAQIIAAKEIKARIEASKKKEESKPAPNSTALLEKTNVIYGKLDDMIICNNYIVELMKEGENE